MKLLLDTHIWLWAIGGSDRLYRRVRRELRKSSNQLWLSPVSIWETLWLHSKGRITLKTSPEEWIAQAMRVAPTTEAPLTHEVSLETRNIVLPHHDPADRFLAATANVFGLTLVTADRVMIAARCCPMLANR